MRWSTKTILGRKQERIITFSRVLFIKLYLNLIMKNKWNERYSSEEYFFGTEPNEFLKEEIEKLSPGKALFIGEGEGRNSVYTSKLGWDVDCLDNSEVGKQKALKLAEDKNVKINYEIGDALNYNYPKDTYDAIAIIYFHVDKKLRPEFNQNITNSLKPNGSLILLVYHEDHLKNKTNGPSDVNVLYTLSEIAEDFIDFEFKTFAQKTLTRVKNGIQQTSTIIKFVGQKV